MLTPFVVISMLQLGATATQQSPNNFVAAVARASNVKVSIDGLKTFKDIRRVLKEKPKLDVDTLDNEIPIHKELYVVRDTHPGYLMQAVATMYRMKWLAFVDGSPMFILAHGVEDMDSMYAPKSDGQKARFKATRLLLDGINALADTSLQSDIYSGTGADVRRLRTTDCWRGSAAFGDCAACSASHQIPLGFALLGDDSNNTAVRRARVHDCTMLWAQCCATLPCTLQYCT